MNIDIEIKDKQKLKYATDKIGRETLIARLNNICNEYIGTIASTGQLPGSTSKERIEEVMKDLYKATPSELLKAVKEKCPDMPIKYSVICVYLKRMVKEGTALQFTRGQYTYADKSIEIESLEDE